MNTKSMDKQTLADKIQKIALLKGEFLLRSGQTSNFYFDKYRFESQPELLKAIAQHMVSLIPKDTDVLAGLEMGGIPIATALAMECGLPVIFVRKEAKAYGTCRVAEGVESLKGLKVCMIEDVVTTGGQVILSAKDIRSEGALINGVLCVIQRNADATQILAKEDLALSALFNAGPNQTLI